MKLPGNPFLRFGRFAVRKLQLEKPGRRNKELCQKLISLAAGKPGAVAEHYARKIADTTAVLTVAALIGLLILAAAIGEDRTVEGQQLERPGYGMGDREEELTVQVEGADREEPVTVRVQERKYLKEEVEVLLERAKESLEKELPGENPSLDQVRTPLHFPQSLEGGAVTVTWLTYPYGLLEDDGSITGDPEETGSLVEIQATLMCQGKELVYETAARIYPPRLSEEEQFRHSLEAAVNQADREEAGESRMTLPGEVAGKKLLWRYPSEELAAVLLLLLGLLPVCVYLQEDQKIHEKAKRRQLQLAMDYSELMWKMTMLLGAGLTIRGAFMRIAEDYRRERPKEVHYVYEEMLCACREMKSGVAESVAYETFGRRCGLPKYIKFGSLLSQNLKKGSKGLAALLEQEAHSSMEERKSMARKLGEQAGTRLLFPMVLMFGIVLVVLIVPAFLSF